ncbi:MAG: hypothetical protein A2Y66_01825 [Nitrospirae bacterium RBG_13_41_22]|nr:MAG: hypothetical protein A2Y66_01825 [Nitrospirae bacterium RBG_13_41_22]
MPDVDINEEQDEVKDKDALDAFNEDENSEEKEDKKSLEKESDGKKEGDEEKKQEEEKNKKPVSAKEKADNRLKDLEEKSEKKEDKEDEKKEVKDEKKVDTEEKKELHKAFTKEDIARRISLISKDDLPENIIIGDNEINLREFAEDEPENYNAIKIISSAIAEKIVNETVNELQNQLQKNMNFVTPDKFEETIMKVGGSVQQISFDLNIAQATTEDGEIKYPTYFRDRQEIKKWAEEKGKENPKAIKLLGSWNPDDAMTALDWYYEEKAGKSAQKHKDEKKKEKDKYDALNSDTSGKHNMIRDKKEGTRNPKQEAKAAFDED